jgi:hypothetical protein
MEKILAMRKGEIRTEIKMMKAPIKIGYPVQVK